MNKNIKNILKEKLNVINLNQFEINKTIEKSINQNNNINISIKKYISYIFSKNTKRGFFETKKHKICIYTGKRSGILKGFSFSRYKTKNLILQNRFTNLKKNNW